MTGPDARAVVEAWKALGRCEDEFGPQSEFCAEHMEALDSAIAALAAARHAQTVEALKQIIALVQEQAEDEALWSVRLDGSLPIAEAYMQQELRRLHAAIEAAALAADTDSQQAAT